ncbi:MAG: hypothetical protein GX141_11680 [Armatimonadetes bacterium]|nr:hypothetical protein [Armatimonadota bacterium]
MSLLQSHSVFTEIVIHVFAAVIAGAIAIRLRQPLIVAFIIVGIIAGPVGLNAIHASEELHMLADMGLALLLFVVGLRLDPKMIRNTGPASFIAGMGMMLVTGAIGYVLCMLMGLNQTASLYIGASLGFSSTVLIVKMLSDKGEADSLYGRIAIGILIVDDIVIVLAMIVLTAFSGSSQPSIAMQAATIILKGAALLSGVWAISKYLFPRLINIMSRSTELLVLSSIAWALSLAGVSELLGFSREVGAFVAGLALASSSYRDVLSTKLASLRDFLLLFFFLDLGSRFDLHDLGAQVIPAIVLSLVVLLEKPVVVMGILGLLGYRRRTGFMAGLTVAQISEFSLILVTLGVSVGHVTEETLRLVTLVLMITMGVDTHLIANSQALYERIGKKLHFFERKGIHREDSEASTQTEGGEHAAILIGLGRYGSRIGAELISRGKKTLGIDFDPESVKMWRERGRDALFGDAEDPDFVHSLPLSTIKWVISSIRDNRLNSGIIRTLRASGYQGPFACAVDEHSENPDDREWLMADVLFRPFKDSAMQAADLVLAADEVIARRSMDKQIESISGHYIICGYGRMGQQIVKDLDRYQVLNVVVESNPEQIPRLKAGNVPYVEGYASEDDTLLKAGILRAKGLIAVASTDEQNVFIVLTAKVLNPKLYVVARSVLKENEDKLRHAGADRVMSPYILGGRKMASAVIKPEVMDFLDLVVHEDSDRTEMAIAVVGEESPWVGKTLGEVNPWQCCGVTPLAVRRQGEALHTNPHSDFVIQAGDEVIVMGKPAEIKSVQDLFL